MDDYPLWNLFLTMMWFFLWVLWLMLLFWIIMDIFRSHDLSGWAKAGWLVLVLIVPFLGILVYMVVRGGQMHERRDREKWDEDNDYTPGRRSSAEQVAALASLRDSGVITEADFQKGKAQVLR
jgi:hypothetical protein